MELIAFLKSNAAANAAAATLPQLATAVPEVQAYCDAINNSPDGNPA